MRDENVYVCLHFRMVESSVWMSGLAGKPSLLIRELAALL